MLAIPRHIRINAAAFAAACLASTPSAAALDIRYSVIDLGVGLFQTVDRNVPAVSDTGFIAGTNTFPVTRAYLWQQGVATLIPPTVANSYTIGYGVNASGAVVGITPGPGINGPIGRPFVYENGNLTLIPDLAIAPSVNVRAAYGINDAGVVVGEWERQAFVYSGGVAQALATPINGAGVRGASGAFDINNNGWAVGESSFPDSLAAILWRDGRAINLGTLPLAPGIRAEASARAINDANAVVGSSRVTIAGGATRSHAFLWQDGQMKDLGTLRGPDWTSAAYGINDVGAVVGQSDCVGLGCAFLWTEDEGMLALQSLVDPGSGWILTRATGINDQGWIVGNGLFNGEARDFLLAPIPEPTTWALLAAGMIGMFALGRRRDTRQG
jgi:probable HAF family extracellular repeat protein